MLTGSSGTSERLSAGAAAGRWCSCHHPKARVKSPQQSKDHLISRSLHKTVPPKCWQACSLSSAACRFVVKATDPSGQKFFLNMCTSEHVISPASWQKHQVGPCLVKSLTRSCIFLCVADVLSPSAPAWHLLQRSWPFSGNIPGPQRRGMRSSGSG